MRTLRTMERTNFASDTVDRAMTLTLLKYTDEYVSFSQCIITSPGSREWNYAYRPEANCPPVIYHPFHIRFVSIKRMYINVYLYIHCPSSMSTRMAQRLLIQKENAGC